jgi:hypothetical protein
MTMKEFAEKYRVRANDKKLAKRYRLSWAEDVVPGRYGEIAEFNDFGETDFRLRLLAVPRTAVMTGALLNRRREALAGGLRLKHKADAESIFYFDPANESEAALALRLVGARRKRQGRPASPRAIAALAAFHAARQNTPSLTDSPLWQGAVETPEVRIG